LHDGVATELRHDRLLNRPIPAWFDDAELGIFTAVSAV